MRVNSTCWLKSKMQMKRFNITGYFISNTARLNAASAEVFIFDSRISEVLHLLTYRSLREHGGISLKFSTKSIFQYLLGIIATSSI